MLTHRNYVNNKKWTQMVMGIKSGVVGVGQLSVIIRTAKTFRKESRLIVVYKLLKQEILTGHIGRNSPVNFHTLIAS